MKKERRALQSSMADPIRDFLSHHRALGKRFLNEERALLLFDRYVAEQKVETLAAITPLCIENFLSSRSRKVAKSYNHLLGVLRRWLDWLVAQERVSEAARLRLQDVDWERGVLSILETKFAKSRLVPFGPRMGVRLQEYRQQRELQVGPLEPTDPLFSFGPGKSRAINPGTVSQTFHQLWPKLGLNLPSGVAAPQLHCLRHSFAVGTLLRWYRQGINPQDRLFHLSTFMGHVHPASTAVYLTITAELLQEANTRFHSFASPLLKEVAS